MNEQQYPYQQGGVPPYPYPYAYPPQPPRPPAPKPKWRRRTIAGVAALGIAGAAALGGAVVEKYAGSQAGVSAASGGSSGGVQGLPNGDGSQGNGSYGDLPGWNQQPNDGSSGSEGSGGNAGQTQASAKQQSGIVTIDTVVDYGTARAAGSGILLTSDGVVLTNHHVIEGSTAITVTDESTGKTYKAEVVGSDETHDVAVLKLVDASGLTPATIDEDGNLKVGDAVTAVGNSEGGGDLMAAAGTVTGLGKTITASGEGGSDAETLSNLIETDADVVSGDSGGALLDSQGEVVGMTTAASAGSNPDGYAIDIDDALAIVNQIRSGNESGTVNLGASAFLGVQLGTDGTITGTVEDSPAAKAGLAAGDTVTAVDGTAVNSAEELSSALAKHDSGDRVRITWTTSEGTTRSATVTLVAGPAK